MARVSIHRPVWNYLFPDSPFFTLRGNSCKVRKRSAKDVHIVPSFNVQFGFTKHEYFVNSIFKRMLA